MFRSKCGSIVEHFFLLFFIFLYFFYFYTFFYYYNFLLSFPTYAGWQKMDWQRISRVPAADGSPLRVQHRVWTSGQERQHLLRPGAHPLGTLENWESLHGGRWQIANLDAELAAGLANLAADMPHFLAQILRMNFCAIKFAGQMRLMQPPIVNTVCFWNGFIGQQKNTKNK